MDLRSILSLMAQKFISIIVVTLSFMICGALISTLLIVPRYEAKATFIINKSNVSSDENDYSYNDYLLTQKLVNTYSVIITSDLVLEQVIDNLELDMSVEALRDILDVSGIDNTEIIELTVTDVIPQRSVDIVNEVSRVAPDEIENMANTGIVKLIDYAKLPDEPVSPNITNNTLFAGLLGFILIMLLYITREYYDNTVKSSKDIEDFLGLPVAGQIPVRLNNKTARTYSLAGNDDFCLVEAYKILGTNTEYSILGNANHKVIMITSSVPGEGKTNISANLGASLTQMNYRVLLMDCDLRKPELYKYFNLSNKAGITNVIFNKINLTDSINKISSQLHVLCAGAIPPNPIEILSSEEMRQLISNVSKEYDYVLLDVPPAAFLTDTALLASCTDGVLFVIKYSSTPKDIIIKAVDNLKLVNAKILGVVFSQIKTKSFTGSHYKYMDQYMNKDKSTKIPKKYRNKGASCKR